MTGPVILDGHGLTCEDVAAVARGGARVEPAPQVAARLERRLRRKVTRHLITEAQAVSRGGAAVTVLAPGPEDLAEIGANLMDPGRRLAVLETSLRTSRAALAEPQPDDLGMIL